MAANSKKAATARRRIADSTALLKALPVAQKFVEKIHNKAQLKLRVVCRGEQVDLPLLGAGVAANVKRAATP